MWFPLLEVKHNRESGTWGLGSGCVYFSRQVGAAGQQGNLLYFLPVDAFAVALQPEDGVLRRQPPNGLAAVWMLLLNKSHLIWCFNALESCF